MKTPSLFLILLSLVIGFGQFAFGSTAPSDLRQGIECADSDIALAEALVQQGWHYSMPEPKSAKAAWGVRDGRTTWWIGYWTNSKTRATSSTQPTKGEDGKFVGDGHGVPRIWRRGGSPATPSKIEWLCSTSGGPSGG